MNLRLASLLAGVLLQGCAGTMIVRPSPNRLANIERGMTRSTVLNLLGLPNEVEKERSPAGELIWIWTYAEGAEARTLALPGATRPQLTNTPGARGLRITWTPDLIVADVLAFGESR